MNKVCDVFGTLVVVIVIVSTACDRKGSQAVFIAGPTESEVDDSGQPNGTQKEAPKPQPIPTASDELLEHAIAATVRLVNNELDASGVILGKDKDDYLYILTVWHAAKHNIQQVDLFSITSLDQKPRISLLGPKLVSKSPPRDLAIIRVKIDAELAFRSVRLVPDPSKLRTPNVAYSAGCSDGRFPTVLSERITGQGRFLPKKDGAEDAVNSVMWTTNSPQRAGRSGGPLLDVNGRLLGIALGKEGVVGYYCHSGEIADYLIDSGPKALVTCPKLE